MARQETVQFAPRVPISWLREYAAMLRNALEAQLPPDAPADQVERVAELDRQLTVRVIEVEAYLARLQAGPSVIN
jgi:hypothetical protein